MLFINFEKVSKDTIIDGSFISIKIMATLTKLKLLSYLILPKFWIQANYI